MKIYPLGNNLPFGIEVKQPNPFEEKVIDRYGNVYKKDSLGQWYAEDKQRPLSPTPIP